MEDSLDVTYTDCLLVIDSWRKVRSIKDYEHRLGYPVFAKWIEIEPETKIPLKIDQRQINEKTPHYQHLVKVYFDMLDVAIDMLGPDLDILTGSLEDLGHRHGSFGAKPPFFTTLGVATICGLRECLGDKLSEEDVDAWRKVYHFLATNMVKGNRTYWAARK